MRHPARTRAVSLAAGLVLLGLAGCASTSGTQGAGALGTLGATPGASVSAGTGQPTTSPTTASPTPTHTAPPAPPKPLTCNQLKSAEVGSKTVSYNGYHDSIPLGGIGQWSGEDGNTVMLEPQCGIGDLDGEGGADAVGVVSLTSGGTGDFYTLVVWHNRKGKPVCVAVADLGDRNPVESITITGGQATVVYDTRTDDAPMAVLNIQRTAVYKLSGSHFTETSRVDVSGTFGG
ncbi:MAG TPA: hypothetical protein VKB69_16085 [Micromonosporaceae bacterium]|nr:hypothetical protein [Micromonosporaceae bacterium]